MGTFLCRVFNSVFYLLFLLLLLLRQSSDSITIRVTTMVDIASSTAENRGINDLVRACTT
jgi:hypothetical protein